jgi:hypothetical protein
VITMSATTLAKTFTRTAKCGHEYEATQFRGKRILCDGCKAAREDIRIGAWVTLGGGAVGQIWAEGERAGSWWIATGRDFVGMSDANVIRNLITTAAPDDVDALFESGAVGAVVGLERVVLEIAEGLDALEAEMTGEAAPADPRPVAVTETYRRRTHDVAEAETGNGSVTTACGTLLATDPQGGAARRGASLGELHGQDRIGERMCPGCVAVAQTSAVRELLATLPTPAADTAVTGIPAPVVPITVPAMGPGESITLSIPADRHEDVKRLARHAVYGEHYDRRIADTLRDVARIWHRGDFPDLAVERFGQMIAWARQADESAAHVEDARRSVIAAGPAAGAVIEWAGADGRTIRGTVEIASWDGAPVGWQVQELAADGTRGAGSWTIPAGKGLPSGYRVASAPIPAPMTVLACGHSTDDVLMPTSRTTCRHDHPSRGGGPVQTYPVVLAGEIHAPAGPITQAVPVEAASGAQDAAPEPEWLARVRAGLDPSYPRVTVEENARGSVLYVMADYGDGPKLSMSIPTGSGAFYQDDRDRARAEAMRTAERKRAEILALYPNGVYVAPRT